MGDAYPFVAPVCQFVTTVWHPNVSSQNGTICLDVLSSKAWSPALTIKGVLLSLLALLQSPAPDDPQDAEVAQMLLRSPHEFRQTAAFWTEMYACTVTDEQVAHVKSMPATNKSHELKIRLLMHMHDGDIARVVAALKT